MSNSLPKAITFAAYTTMAGNLVVAGTEVDVLAVNYEYGQATVRSAGSLRGTIALADIDFI